MSSAVQVWSFLLEPVQKKLERDGETVVLYWLLRLGVLACYVGHGAFGIITKAEWLPFFAAVGIPAEIAWKLMPLIGIMDITMGVIGFFWPTRAIIVWATIWCVWTALLRPLAGMSFFETMERAGNYGIPLVLLLSTTMRGSGWRAWFFSKLEPLPLTPALARRLVVVLLVVTSLLLAGHGGFGAFLTKDLLAQHYAAIGLGGADGKWLVRLIGGFELTLAVIVLLYPARWLLVGILGWKLFTEFLYPISGTPIFETIERGGSYAAPLALLILFAWLDRTAPAPVPADRKAAGGAARDGREAVPAGSLEERPSALAC